MTSGDLPPNPETPEYEYRVVCRNSHDEDTRRWRARSLEDAQRIALTYTRVGATARVQRRAVPTPWEDV